MSKPSSWPFSWPSASARSAPVEAKIRRAAYASIVVAALVTAIKYVAYDVTGSVALYSDALESVANIVTAVAVLAAVRLSLRPADAEHPFGHDKAEYFSAVLEGVLIIVAALLVLDAAWSAVKTPRVVEAPALGLGINLVAALINAFWGWRLIRAGGDWSSPALAADGWHLMTDVATSIGVAIGLVVATLTGWTILDPLLAAVVAVHILWSGYRIVRASLSSLLDEAAAPETEERISAAIRAHGAGAIEAHDLRTRQAGRALFVEFHLIVPGDMTVDAAHEICDRLEKAIAIAVEGARTVIHVEPEHKAKIRRADGAIRLS